MRLIDVLSVAAALLGVVWLAWMILRGHGERHDEDAARAFFDAHGHWPDEDPAAATPAPRAPEEPPPVTVTVRERRSRGRGGAG
jgi:hypothetical protein